MLFVVLLLWTKANLNLFNTPKHNDGGCVAWRKASVREILDDLISWKILNYHQETKKNKKYGWTWKLAVYESILCPEALGQQSIKLSHWTERLLKSPYWIMVVRYTVSSMMFCKKGCSNGIRAWSSATAVPSLKWLSSYLKATELHYVMYRLRQDRMDVIEINLIFFKLASDYELLQSKFMSSRIQFPPWCDMLLSVGNYSVGPNNESCHRDPKRGECLMATILWPLELSPTSTIYQKTDLKVPRLHTAVLAMRQQQFQNHMLINLEPI